MVDSDASASAKINFKFPFADEKFVLNTNTEESGTLGTGFQQLFPDKRAHDYGFEFIEDYPVKKHLVFPPNISVKRTLESAGSTNITLKPLTDIEITALSPDDKDITISLEMKRVNTNSDLALLNVLPARYNKEVVIAIGKSKYPPETFIKELFPLTIDPKNSWKISPKHSTALFPRFGHSEMEELIRFRKVGVEILRDSKTTPVIEAIREVDKQMKKYPFDANPPFVFVSAPSLSGKTELFVYLDLFSKHSYWKEEVVQETQESLFSLVLPIVLIKNLAEDFIQRIYRCTPGSQGLVSEASSDILEIKKLWGNPDDATDRITGTSLSGDDLKDFEYLFLGFFVEILKQIKNGSMMQIEKNSLSQEKNLPKLSYGKMTLAAAREAIKSLKVDAKPIVAFIDEFNTHSSKFEPKPNPNSTSNEVAYFIRNILREAGVVVIVAGTDTNAWNLLEMQQSLSGQNLEHQEKPWLYLVRDLPPPTESAVIQASGIDIRKQVQELKLYGAKHFLDWVLRADGSKHLKASKKAGFFVLFTRAMQYLNSTIQDKPESVVILMNSLLNVALKSALDRKRLLFLAPSAGSHWPPIGLYGQYFILFPTLRYLEGEEISYFPPELVHKHYGDLALGLPAQSKNDECYPVEEGQGPLAMYRSNGEFLSVIEKNAQRIVNLFSSFPVFSDDELFYLVMTSMGKVRPFAGSFISLVEKLYKSAFYRLYSKSSTRRKRSPRDGDKLENIAVGATILATHTSVAGVTLESFFKSLLSELSQDNSYPGLAVPQELSKLLSGTRLPYFPPSGATASEALRKIPGIVTGNLTQSENEEEIDVVAVPVNILNNPKKFENDEFYKKTLLGLLIECKNYQKNVNGGIVKTVMKKMLKNVGKHQNSATQWIGLLFVARLANIKLETWEKIESKYPLTKVYTMRRSSTNPNTIDFICQYIPPDIVEDDTTETDQDASGSESEDDQTETEAKRAKTTPLPFHLFIIEVENIFGETL